MQTILTIAIAIAILFVLVHVALKVMKTDSLPKWRILAGITCIIIATKVGEIISDAIIISIHVTSS